MDKNSVEIFANAVRKGTYEFYHIRIMFVGHSGVGKTTLALGIIPDSTDISSITSTDGIDIFNEQCYYNRLYDMWKRQSFGFKSFSAAGILAKTTFEDNVPIDLTRKSHETEKENASTTSEQVFVAPSSAETKGFEDVVPNTNETFDTDLLERTIGDYVGRYGESHEEIVPVDIWDFGGQSIYYTTHQAFLTDRSIYILPVNVSLPFEHHLTDTHLDPSRPEKRTIKAFMSFWICSITSYVNSGYSGYPKMIIVGTHLDKIPEDERRQSIQSTIEFIRKNFKGEVESSQLVIDEQLFLDARNKKDPGFRALRKKVIEVAEGQKQWGEKLPKSWLPVQEKVLDEKKMGKKILTIVDVKKMNASCITPVDDEEIGVILQFLHSVGQVLYFNDPGLKDKVILDPKWIIDILKSFITDKSFCESDKLQTWEKMSKEGIIEDSVIDQLWNKPEFELFGQNKTYLLKVLESLDIIARPKSYDTKGNASSLPFYYVPSMLNEIASSEVKSSVENGVDMNFHFPKILPIAVYNRLTAACLTMWTVKDSSLFFGFSIFKVDLFHALALQKDEETILARVSNTRGIQANANVCSGIRTFLESTLNRIVSLYQNTNATIDAGSRKVFTVEGMQLEKSQCRRNEPYCPDTCNGLPVEELDKQPTDCELVRLSRELPFDYFHRVGAELGFLLGKVEEIFNCDTGRTQRYFHLLRTWKNKNGKKSTFRCLNQALSQISEIGDHEHVICKIHRISETIDEDELPADVKSKIPSDKVLEGSANVLCKDYLQVAMELGVDYHDLMEIEENNKHNVLLRIQKMLLKWKEKSTVRPTAEMLAKALKISDCDYGLFCENMMADK